MELTPQEALLVHERTLDRIRAENNRGDRIVTALQALSPQAAAAAKAAKESFDGIQKDVRDVLKQLAKDRNFNMWAAWGGAALGGIATFLLFSIMFPRWHLSSEEHAALLLGQRHREVFDRASQRQMDSIQRHLISPGEWEERFPPKKQSTSAPRN